MVLTLSSILSSQWCLTGMCYIVAVTNCLREAIQGKSMLLNMSDHALQQTIITVELCGPFMTNQKERGARHKMCMCPQ